MLDILLVTEIGLIKQNSVPALIEFMVEYSEGLRGQGNRH